MCHNLCDPTARWSLVIGLMSWITQVYQLGINYKPATFHGFICYFWQNLFPNIHILAHSKKVFTFNTKKSHQDCNILKNPKKTQ